MSALMDSFHPYYRNLGVPPSADAGMIEAAVYWAVVDRVDPETMDLIDASSEILADPQARLLYDCEVAVRVELMENHIIDGRELVATAGAKISEMEKRLTDYDRVLRAMENRWPWLAAADSVDAEDYPILQVLADDVQACRTELEARCAIESKRLVEHQDIILKQISTMEPHLEVLRAERRNLAIPPSNMESPDNYQSTLSVAWDHAMKKANDAGLRRYTWPVYEALDAEEYVEELILHRRKIRHQAKRARRRIDKEIRDKDLLIAEKDILLTKKDDQVREKDVQIEERDALISEMGTRIWEMEARIREKNTQIREKDQMQRISVPIPEVDGDQLYHCRFCKKKTKFDEKYYGYYRVWECLECETPG